MRILFMGSGEVACPSLERLLHHSDHDVVAVVSRPDKPQGRHRIVAPCPAKAFAEAHGVPVLTPERIGSPEAVEEIKALEPDIIVVVAYGQFIKPEILSIPAFEAINVHPSLLPKYRGASPIQWALANGEQETGVTVLYVSEEMDAGDIIVRRSMAIDPDDTALTLSPRLAALGADLLVEALNAIRAGVVERIPQDHEQATVVYKLQKEHGRIDWTMPAETIRNRIRGFTPWPGCYTMYEDRLLKVLRAETLEKNAPVPVGTVVCRDESGPVIAAGEGCLRLLELQPEGKIAMSGQAFLCGHRLPDGTRLG